MSATYLEVYIGTAKNLHVSEQSFTKTIKEYQETYKSSVFTYKELHTHDKRLTHFPKTGQTTASIMSTVSTSDDTNLMWHWIYKENLPLHLFPSSDEYNIKKWVYRTTFRLTQNLFLNFQKETYDDESSTTYNIIYYNHNKPHIMTDEERDLIMPISVSMSQRRN